MAFTYFFRDSQTIELMVKFLVKYSSGKSHIKIWNPGCASGQEPYTLAMILAENMGRFAFKNVEIHATDIDASNLFQKPIMDGIFPYEDLQRIPKHLFDKYFQLISGNNYQIDYILRSRMKYIKHNLTSLKPIDKDYSLVLCKNVLLHLEQNERIDVIRMFYHSLAEGGILVMEQTQKLPDEVSYLFHPIVTNAQIYLKL